MSNKTFKIVPFLSAALCLFASQAWPADAKGNSAVIGRLDGTSWTENDLREESGLTLYQQESTLYSFKRGWIEKKAKDALFDQAAKDANLPRKDWEKREIDSKVPATSDKEVDQFIQDRHMPPQASNPEMRKRIAESLTLQKRSKIEQEIYQKLVVKHHLEVLLPKPIAPRIDVVYSGDTPAKGPSKAKVTIVEFSDFQCPYCKRAQDSLRKVEELYKGKVKLVSIQFPLDMHERAKPAAEAALCAHEQGKYWEYQDKLFAKQELSDEDFKRYAKELSLDQGKFSACLSEHRYAQRVQADVAQGLHLGIRGTPTFVINGRPFIGGSLENFQEAIDESLIAAK